MAKTKTQYRILYQTPLRVSLGLDPTYTNACDTYEKAKREVIEGGGWSISIQTREVTISDWVDKN